MKNYEFIVRKAIVGNLLHELIRLCDSSLEGINLFWGCNHIVHSPLKKSIHNSFGNITFDLGIESTTIFNDDQSIFVYPEPPGSALL